MTKTKSYGLDWKKELEEQSHEDWIFSSISDKCLASIPVKDRQHYLPAGERQNIGSEKSDCATRAPLNILEAKFNYLVDNEIISVDNVKWLQDNGYFNNGKIEFSDRFVAINSGTTRAGNSLKAPLEAIRKQGLIPKSMFPQVDDFDEYYDRRNKTKKMDRLGEEFEKRFPINYEKVYESDFPLLLKKDMLDVGGYAWPRPINGEYPRVSYRPNHAFIIYKPQYYAFDNYIADGSFTKKLAPDYDFLDYAYRVYISKEKQVQVEEDWLTQLIRILREAGYNIGHKLGSQALKDRIEQLKRQIALLRTRLEAPKGTTIDVYLLSKRLIGKNMRTRTSKALGCADAINNVFKKATGREIGGDVSTHRMYNKLWNHRYFKEVSDPKPGDIIISPTGFGNGRVLHGHVGIVSDNDRIMSNNSHTGLWDEHWDIKSWERFYKQDGGFPMKYYRLST